jgi:hypothetical protein
MGSRYGNRSIPVDSALDFRDAENCLKVLGASLHPNDIERPALQGGLLSFQARHKKEPERTSRAESTRLIVSLPLFGLHSPENPAVSNQFGFTIF